MDYSLLQNVGISDTEIVKDEPNEGLYDSDSNGIQTFHNEEQPVVTVKEEDLENILVIKEEPVKDELIDPLGEISTVKDENDQSSENTLVVKEEPMKDELINPLGEIFTVKDENDGQSSEEELELPFAVTVESLLADSLEEQGISTYVNCEVEQDQDNTEETLMESTETILGLPTNYCIGESSLPKDTTEPPGADAEDLPGKGIERLPERETTFLPRTQIACLPGTAVSAPETSVAQSPGLVPVLVRRRPVLLVKRGGSMMMVPTHKVNDTRSHAPVSVILQKVLLLHMPTIAGTVRSPLKQALTASVPVSRLSTLTGPDQRTSLKEPPGDEIHDGHGSDLPHDEMNMKNWSPLNVIRRTIAIKVRPQHAPVGVDKLQTPWENVNDSEIVVNQTHVSRPTSVQQGKGEIRNYIDVVKQTRVPRQAPLQREKEEIRRSLPVVTGDVFDGGEHKTGKRTSKSEEVDISRKRTCMPKSMEAQQQVKMRSERMIRNVEGLRSEIGSVEPNVSQLMRTSTTPGADSHLDGSPKTAQNARGVTDKLADKAVPAACTSTPASVHKTSERVAGDIRADSKQTGLWREIIHRAYASMTIEHSCVPSPVEGLQRTEDCDGCFKKKFRRLSSFKNDPLFADVEGVAGKDQALREKMNDSGIVVKQTCVPRQAPLQREKEEIRKSLPVVTCDVFQDGEQRTEKSTRKSGDHVDTTVKRTCVPKSMKAQQQVKMRSESMIRNVEGLRSVVGSVEPNASQLKRTSTTPGADSHFGGSPKSAQHARGVSDKLADKAVPAACTSTPASVHKTSGRVAGDVRADRKQTGLWRERIHGAFPNMRTEHSCVRGPAQEPKRTEDCDGCFKEKSKRLFSFKTDPPFADVEGAAGKDQALRRMVKDSDIIAKQIYLSRPAPVQQETEEIRTTWTPSYKTKRLFPLKTLPRFADAPGAYKDQALREKMNDSGIVVKQTRIPRQAPLQREKEEIRKSLPVVTCDVFQDGEQRTEKSTRKSEDHVDSSAKRTCVPKSMEAQQQVKMRSESMIRNVEGLRSVVGSVGTKASQLRRTSTTPGADSHFDGSPQTAQNAKEVTEKLADKAVPVACTKTPASVHKTSERVAGDVRADRKLTGLWRERIYGAYTNVSVEHSCMPSPVQEVREMERCTGCLGIKSLRKLKEEDWLRHVMKTMTTNYAAGSAEKTATPGTAEKIVTPATTASTDG